MSEKSATTRTFVVVVHCSNCGTTYQMHFPVGTNLEQNYRATPSRLECKASSHWADVKPVACVHCDVAALTRRERNTLCQTACSRAGGMMDSRGWISVDERLPDDGKDVLAWPHGDVLCRIEAFNDRDFHYPTGWYRPDGTAPVTRQPTHWMPLPDPPIPAHSGDDNGGEQ